jgi:prepilin-type N-terminal cleavage/methylation domain-containing protein
LNARRQSGHTLLELLVVLVIMSILAGIVIPAATVDGERKLDTLQLSIQDAINFAQAQSYNKGAPFGVRFDTDGQWFSVVNENGVPIADPLSKGDYLIRLNGPGVPSNVHIDYAMYGPRPLAAFDGKGVLVEGGEIHLRAGTTERWLTMDTATATLMEIPVSP